MWYGYSPHHMGFAGTITLSSATFIDVLCEICESVLRQGVARLDDEGSDYLAQDFDSFLHAYDFVALMAMPAMEGAKDHEEFYEKLVAAVRRREEGLERTIFELQTIDWLHSKPVPGGKLRSTMRWLQSLGVRNLGYYPDDFIEGLPDFEQLRLGMSLADDFVGARR